MRLKSKKATRSPAPGVERKNATRNVTCELRVRERLCALKTTATRTSRCVLAHCAPRHRHRLRPRLTPPPSAALRAAAARTAKTALRATAAATRPKQHSAPPPPPTALRAAASRRAPRARTAKAALRATAAAATRPKQRSAPPPPAHRAPRHRRRQSSAPRHHRSRYAAKAALRAAAAHRAPPPLRGQNSAPRHHRPLRVSRTGTGLGSGLGPGLTLIKAAVTALALGGVTVLLGHDGDDDAQLSHAQRLLVRSARRRWWPPSAARL